MKRIGTGGKSDKQFGTPKWVQYKFKQLLNTTQTELGYTQAIWDGKLVCKYISDTYSPTIAVRTAQDWMHKIGFTRQRPRYYFNKADQALNEQLKARMQPICCSTKKTRENPYMPTEPTRANHRK